MKRVWRKYNYQQVSQYKRAKLKFRTPCADKTYICSNHMQLDYVGLLNLKQISSRIWSEFFDGDIRVLLTKSQF